MKVIVVGGGAAGMMAALSAAESGNRVTLLEKNEKLGKKLFITGKGRCNLTNAADMDAFFSNICSNPKFLYSAFEKFDNRAVMELVEKAGCPLKTERGERVFPVSDHSSDVIAALFRELKRRNVEIRLHTEVKELIIASEEDAAAPVFSYFDNRAGSPDDVTKNNNGCYEGSGAVRRCTGVRLSDGKTLDCDKCVICTGGVSYPSTGSTGDGYRFAEETGHRLVPVNPALVPLETEEKWCSELMGLSLKNVEAELVCGKKVLYKGFGEMLFTHFGISGPLVLSASSFYAKRKNDNVNFYIDLKPALTEEQLDRRLLKDFDENKNKAFKNSLSGLFPAKMIPVMVELSDIDGEKKVNEITKAERQHFAALIKRLPLTVKGTRPFSEAIITQGGVNVKDINPSTMESKIIKDLYFAGEVLDLDALTGGFNLQIAWSTGYLAGETKKES